MRITMENKWFSLDLSCDWDQFFNKKRWSWREYNWLKVLYEVDAMHYEREIEVYIVGFGVRLYWIYDKEKNMRVMRKYVRQYKCSKK